MRTATILASTVLYLTCLSAAKVSAGNVPPVFYSCTSYHCKSEQQVQLSSPQWQAVRRLFGHADSPEAERRQLRRAVALLEQQTGAITGTWRDLAGNVAGAGQPGQLDCIAESKNTTTYLQLLSDAGLLEWHVVEARQVRHPLIFNVHWTAVIRDTRDNRRYAVDSWFLDNGEPPYIQPLEDWKSGRRFERGQEDLGDQ
jgi:hypothetical protein